jgi:hypothetical protein
MTSPTLPVVSIAFSDDGTRAVTSHFPIHPSGTRVSWLHRPDGVMQIWEQQTSHGLSEDRLLASRTFQELSIHQLRFPPESKTLNLVLRHNASHLVTCDADSLKWSTDSIPRFVSAVSPDGRYSAGEDADVDLLPILDSPVSPDSRHSSGGDTDVAVNDTVVLIDRQSETRTGERAPSSCH